MSTSNVSESPKGGRMKKEHSRGVSSTLGNTKRPQKRKEVEV